MKPFSHRVLDAIAGMKTVTVEELVPLFPEKRRHEISKALMNAELRGLVKMDRSTGRKRGEKGEYAPCVWAVLVPEPPKKSPIPCVSCVWDLGSGPVQVPYMQGRKYSPLGGWNA